MAILTKAQLQADNSASFADNNTQAITPQILRAYNGNIIDTLVDSLVTGSFANTAVSNDFTAANQFTSISASSFISASAFVGDGSKLTNITASIALPILDEGILQGYATSMNFTGSAISATIVGGTAVVQVNIDNVGLVTTASFNAYTQSTNQFTASTNTSITNLNASSASQQVSINNLNTTTASLLVETQNLELFSSSTLTRLTNIESTTASLNSSVTQLNASSASQQVSIDNLNQFTASQSTASLVTSITNLNTFSASALVSISNLNSTTASLNTSVTNINSATASLFTSASLALVTASFDTGTRNLTFTKGNTQTFSVNIPDASGSTIPAGTISSSAQITSLGFVSSSITGGVFVSASQVFSNQIQLYYGDGSSVAVQINNVENAVSASYAVTASHALNVQTINTASFATTGSNTFNGNQTINGNITAFSASFTYLQTTYESSSVIYSSGSNIFGDELTDTQTLSGSVKVQGSLTVNGTPVLTSSVDISGLTTTASFNAYTQSNDSKVNSLINATASYATSAITASSLITASAVGNTITFTKGDTSTFNVSVTPTPIDTGSLLTTASFNAYTSSNDQKVNSLVSATGSYATTGSNTFVGNQTLTGSLFISGNINMVNGADIVTHHVKAAGSNGLELQTSAGTIIVAMGAGGGTQAGFVGAVTANSISASTINGLGDPLAFSTSVDSRLDSLEGVSGSFTTTASFNSYTSSNDAKVNSLISATGSYATTGSNSFNGNQLVKNGAIQAASYNETSSQFYGPVVFQGVGTASVAYDHFVNAGNFDSLHIESNLNAGTIFQDYDGSNVNTWLSIPTNTGSNPSPVMTRGLQVTGSTQVQNFTASLQQGYVYVGNASGITTTVATSSFGTPIPTGTISGSQQITALGFVSSSVTASSLITASVNLNTITFTKGDASTFAITVNTGSGGGGSTDTGSLMRTGSVAGNVLTFTKGDATTFTLTVATGSGGGGAAFPFTGDAVITGSLGVSGSIFGGVIPITVASSTASIDFSKGNMFTLTLPSASTHIVPTNIRAGQTCNIQITQPTPGTGSVTFSPLVLFAGGNDYQATATGSAVDMLTLVSFNGTNTIAAGIKNLL